MNWRLLLQGLRRLLSLVKVEKRQTRALAASFGLAFSLWLILTLTQEYNSFVTVPVRVWADQESFPHESVSADVLVSVRGSGLDLLMEHLRFQRDTVLLSSRAFPVGDSVLVFENSQFSRGFSSQVKILALSPKQIPVVFPRLEEKEVPVELATELVLVPPLRLVSEPVLSPKTVVIRGQAAALDTLVAWKTARSSLRVDKAGIYPLDLMALPGASPAVQRVSLQVNPVRFAEVKIQLPVQVAGGGISSTRVRFSSPVLTFFLVMPENRVATFLDSISQMPLKVPFKDLSPAEGIWAPPGDWFGEEVKIIRTEPHLLRYVLYKQQEKL